MTISGSAFTYGGNYIRLHIHHNGERLDESWYAGADTMTEFYDDDEITKIVKVGVRNSRWGQQFPLL